MGVCNSKSNVENDDILHQGDPDCGNEASDEKELIALKLIAEAEHATFDQLNEQDEGIESGLEGEVVSVAESDVQSDMHSEYSNDSEACHEPLVELDINDIDDDGLSIPTTIMEQSEMDIRSCHSVKSEGLKSNASLNNSKSSLHQASIKSKKINGAGSKKIGSKKGSKKGSVKVTSIEPETIPEEQEEQNQEPESVEVLLSDAEVTPEITESNNDTCSEGDSPVFEIDEFLSVNVEQIDDLQEKAQIQPEQTESSTQETESSTQDSVDQDPTSQNRQQQEQSDANIEAKDQEEKVETPAETKDPVEVESQAVESDEQPPLVVQAAQVTVVVEDEVKALIEDAPDVQVMLVPIDTGVTKNQKSLKKGVAVTDWGTSDGGSHADIDAPPIMEEPDSPRTKTLTEPAKFEVSKEGTLRVASIDRQNPLASQDSEQAKLTIIERTMTAVSSTDRPRFATLSKAEREADNRKAQMRMQSEMDHVKRREHSIANRKRAATIAMDAAKGSRLSYGGSNLNLAAADGNLLFCQSLPNKTMAASTEEKYVQSSSDSNLRSKQSKNTLRLNSDKPMLRLKAEPKSRTSSFTGKSIRKKLKQRLKSTRNNSAKKSGGTVKRKPGAITVAEIDAGGVPSDDGFEDLDARAIEAARWTDKVVRQLIDEIKQRGYENSHGQFCITFGQLFEETANIFDALVGIIKTAKKYHVMHCNKDQLWQGQDDQEVITLLKDVHSGVVINRRKRGQLKGVPAGKKGGFGTSTLANQNNKCAVCTKTVYPMEFVGANDKAFHKACFKCKVCRNRLKPTDFCTVNDEFFCQTHYIEMINAAGGVGKEHDKTTFNGTTRTASTKCVA